jgi:hypothetical protein
MGDRQIKAVERGDIFLREMGPAGVRLQLRHTYARQREY